MMYGEVKAYERPWKLSAHTQKVLIKMFKVSKKNPTLDTVFLTTQSIGFKYSMVA